MVFLREKEWRVRRDGKNAAVAATSRGYADSSDSFRKRNEDKLICLKWEEECSVQINVEYPIFNAEW